MATVSQPVLQTGKSVSIFGAYAFWTARRTPRADVEKAFVDSGAGTDFLPDVDNYDSLVEAGKKIIDKLNLKRRNTPVKFDSLSRTTVGVEFWRLHKSDKRNSRESLFAIGVTDSNEAFMVSHNSDNQQVDTFATLPQCDQIINGLYQQETLKMSARDVTESLRSVVVHHRGMSQKEGGGVYFVPDCGLQQIDKLFAAMNNCGNRCTLLQHDLSDNDELARQVLEATNENIVEAAAKMNEVMQDIRDNDKKPRINGLNTRVAEASRLADLLQYYEQMFSTNLTEARKTLDVTFELIAEMQIRYGDVA